MLQFEATQETENLERAREGIFKEMAIHVSHTGVHDHGFNIVSTYGNFLRLSRAGRLDEHAGERRECELAIKVSGAVQVSRWT